MTTLIVRSAGDNTRWRVATGAGSRYPYWVFRVIDGRQEYAPNKSDRVRKFATMESAQKVADKLQVTADFDASREHLRLAVHHMIRATDHLQPDDPIMETLSRISDLYLELTGKQL
jgi:hypothetical protein